MKKINGNYIVIFFCSFIFGYIFRDMLQSYISEKQIMNYCEIQVGNDIDRIEYEHNIEVSETTFEFLIDDCYGTFGYEFSEYTKK